MKTAAKKATKKAAKKAVAKKRDLFAEISDGFAALARSREGKQTLRTHKVEFKPAPKVTSKDVAKLRKKLDLSQAVFATRLRMNEDTVKNWEQGRSVPNTQAALLLALVDKYPDTLDRIAQL